jgi:hypothetical protein
MRTWIALLSTLVIIAGGSPAGKAARTDGLDFVILREDNAIGRHRVGFSQRDGDLHVDIRIEIDVSILFVPVFTYRHSNHEIWRNGRLIALETWTNDDGTEYTVSARATEAGLHVAGSEGEFMAPPDIIPTSYWDSRTVERGQLLDTQRGGILEVDVDRVAKERVRMGDKDVDAVRYRITGDLEVDLWYSEGDERWAKIAFDARGAAVEYDPAAANRPSDD